MDYNNRGGESETQERRDFLVKITVAISGLVAAIAALITAIKS